MKNKYITPELEVLEFSEQDVILTSPTEASIPEIIGGGGGDENPTIPDLGDL